MKKKKKTAATPPSKRKAKPRLVRIIPIDGLTPKQSAFLAAFQICATVSRAARAAKVDRHAHYTWMDDPVYAKAFQRARDRAVQVLEDEAVHRAYEGVLKPVFYMGERVDVVLEKSDGLLMFLLKAWAPERYRERVEHTGADGGPIEIDLVERLNAGRQRLALLKPDTA